MGCTCLKCTNRANLVHFLQGVQLSPKGVQLSLRGCSCLNCTNQVNYTFCSVGALFAWLVHLRQVHPLSMHLQVPPESPYSRYCTFSATYNE